jgi:hypothetical protein
VAARQTADLAELKDRVEGIRTAGHNARREGNLSLANALDMTLVEVYDSYLDEEYTSNRAKRLVARGARSQRAVIGSDREHTPRRRPALA